MEVKINFCLLIVCVGLALFALVEAKKKAFSEEDCEVCVKFIKKFEEEEVTDKMRSDTKAIEEKFKEFCKKATGKDERFCYFIGGSADSATSILQELSRPLSYHKPAVKICESLKSKDPQICDLKYEKQIDFTEVDFKKLKVKDLKKILSGWGEDKACKGCTEKTEFIRVVKQLLPKYAPEAAKILQERDEL